MLWSVLIAGAVAGKTPVTCEAVFIGPVAGCALEGQWVASGTAGTESGARKRALARLTEAIDLTVAANAERASGSLAAVVAEQERASCPAAVEEAARVSCFPSPELAAPLTCFADFPTDDCPTPDVLILSGVGFKVMEKARGQVCQESEAMLQTGAFSTDEQLACRAQCLTDARIRCR